MGLFIVMLITEEGRTDKYNTAIPLICVAIIT